MGSLVEELQRDALDGSIPVSDLLRKAKVIAAKLELPELEKWVENELNGYKNDFPDYRKVYGRLFCNDLHTPSIPMQFSNTELENNSTERYLSYPAIALEDMISHQELSQLEFAVDADTKQMLRKTLSNRNTSDYVLRIPSTSITAVLGSIRNILLDWMLKLEKAGVKGEGMSFSADAKEKAHEAQVTYNIGSIGNLVGNLGPIGGNVTAQGNVIDSGYKVAIESLISQIKTNEMQLQLNAESTQQLKLALDNLQSEIKSQKPNTSHVQQLLVSIRGIAEKAAGTLVASSILHEIGKILS